MKELNVTLATELIREIKASAKRWFIIALVELFIIIGIVVTFVWYLNTPEEEVTETTTYTQDADTEGDDSPIEQRIGE